MANYILASEISWVYIVLIIVLLSTISIYVVIKTYNSTLWLIKVLIMCMFSLIIIFFNYIMTWSRGNIPFDSLKELTIMKIYSTIPLQGYYILSILIITIISFLIFRINNEKVNVSNTGIIVVMTSSALGFVSTLLSVTWIQLFLAIELATLPLYILIASRLRNILAVEGAIKYFLMSSLLSFIFLVSMSVLIKSNGSLNIYNFYLLNLYENLNLYVIISSIVIILILLAKLPVVPFHMAVVDGYAGSNVGILPFLLLAPKFAILNVIYNLINESLFGTLGFIIMITLLLSLIIPSIFVFGQTKLKKFIIYTSIFHNAFFIAPLLTNSAHSIVSSNEALLVYLLIMMSFLVLMSLLKTIDGESIDGLNILRSVNNSYSTLGKFVVLNVLSMGGIPPLAGFFMKLYILYICIETTNYFLGFILILFSIPLLYGYLRIIQLFLLNDTSNKQKNILLQNLGYIGCIIASSLIVFNYLLLKDYFFFDNVFIFLVFNYML
jgi:NADH-quinone oxidoreductase subunit N